MALETYTKTLDAGEKQWHSIDADAAEVESISFVDETGNGAATISDSFRLVQGEDTYYYFVEAVAAGTDKFKFTVTLKSGGVDIFWVQVTVI